MGGKTLRIFSVVVQRYDMDIFISIRLGLIRNKMKDDEAMSCYLCLIGPS